MYFVPEIYHVRDMDVIAKPGINPSGVIMNESMKQKKVNFEDRSLRLGLLWGLLLGFSFGYFDWDI